MYPEQIELDNEKLKELRSNQHECNFRSKYNFFNEHNGIRNNKMHLLIAPTGAGKSTLIRSVFFDVINNNRDKKILIWLTEETKDEFYSEISNYATDSDVLQNVRVISELQGYTNEDDTKKLIEEAIDLYDLDLLMVDNITTSNLYMDTSIKNQAELCKWFKGLCKSTALFIVAHTNNNNFNNRLLDENDIRGSRSITNLTEFLYVLQPVRINNSLFQFINIIKHRGQNIDNRFFMLKYNKQSKLFLEDVASTFDDINQLFKQRNKLG